MQKSLLGENLLVLAAYVAASELALGLLSHQGAAIVWFASAVALAALLLRGVRVVPGIAGGALACALLGGKGPLAAPAIAALTTGQIVLAWWLMTRFARFSPRFERVRDVLLLAAIGATVSPAIHAARILVAAWWRDGTLTAPAIGFAEVVSLGEVVGILLVVPLVLAWRQRPADPQPRRAEEAALYLVTVVASIGIFGAMLRPMMHADSLPYALFPLAFWAAFRFGMRQTAVVLFLAALTAIACHGMGEGPFVQRRVADHVRLADMASLYLFLAVLSVSSLVIAAAIRERAAAERQVRDSERRYRNLIERMSEGVNITDASRRMVFVSDRFCEMVGYPREELIGREGREITVEEDRERWVQSHVVREAGAAEPHQLTLRRRNGELLYAWISPKPLYAADGTYEGSLNVVMDMTAHRRAEEALRESEEKYRLLVDNQTDLVMKLCAKTSRVLYASPSHEAFFGKPVDAFVGKPFAEAVQIHDEDREAVAASWRMVCCAPFSAAHETRVMTARGWRWLAWSARAVLDAAGSPDFVITVGRDVTDRRRAEEQARQHLQQLAHVSRVSSMGEMASAIAHEINQPLTAISNYTAACARLLGAGKASLADATETMQRVAAEAQRAGEIVRKMRGFVRGEESQLSRVDVNFLVAEVLRLAGPEARQLGVELSWAPAAGLAPVLADSIQIQQVLLNLVRNAAEAISSADSEARRVTVTAQPAGAMVEISVRDTGPGIAADALEKVFDPFFTTKADGIGIGLALSRSIVDAHGGRLWTDLPADGRGGAVFHLTLPVAEEPQHAEA